MFIDIREKIITEFGNCIGSIDIGGVRTVRTFRTYCTKSDCDALNKGRVDDLSSFYRQVLALKGSTDINIVQSWKGCKSDVASHPH